jgi:uncharacterized membrane protein YhaH (DUF805 family)
MNLGWLLCSFRGRINRKPYWLTALGMLAYMAVVALVASAVARSPEGALGLVFAGLLPAIWAGLAVAAKRLHDRDKSAWWLLVFFVLPSVLERMGDSAGAAGGAPAGMALYFAAFVVSVWGLVELGFLRGTAGPNRFGPDPLQPAYGYPPPGYGPQGYGPQGYGPPPGYGPQGYGPPPGYGSQPGYGPPPGGPPQHGPGYAPPPGGPPSFTNPPPGAYPLPASRPPNIRPKG